MKLWMLGAALAIGITGCGTRTTAASSSTPPSSKAVAPVTKTVKVTQQVTKTVSVPTSSAKSSTSASETARTSAKPVHIRLWVKPANIPIMGKSVVNYILPTGWRVQSAVLLNLTYGQMYNAPAASVSNFRADAWLDMADKGSILEWRVVFEGPNGQTVVEYGGHQVAMTS